MSADKHCKIGITMGLWESLYSESDKFCSESEMFWNYYKLENVFGFIHLTVIESHYST